MHADPTDGGHSGQKVHFCLPEIAVLCTVRAGARTVRKVDFLLRLDLHGGKVSSQKLEAIPRTQHDALSRKKTESIPRPFSSNRAAGTSEKC